MEDLIGREAAALHLHGRNKNIKVRHQRTGRSRCDSAEGAGSASPPGTAYSNWVNKVGGKLNSASFLIAPACNFLTDAISAN